LCPRGLPSFSVDLLLHPQIHTGSAEEDENEELVQIGERGQQLEEDLDAWG